ncbi:MAG TPA: CoA ester lyase [Gaiellaceae bacterium]|jgi:citrate lyase subunit beta/citryl-CoA lyase|nr:CoA ester lyase [Gaiellaceae bacterium]
MTALETARSFLFAPGSDEHKLRKALAAAADAVVADLEDAVAAAEKPAAREIVVRVLSETGSGPLRLVRVNGAATPWHDGDLAAVERLAPDGLVLPKATPEAMRELARLGLPVLAIVETADGLRRAYELASTRPTAGLILGAVDLGLALRLEPRPDGQELLFARSSLVVDSAAAGIRGPIDQVWVDVRDTEGLDEDCRFARSLGFRGKACIHPGQVPVVNEAFAPSADELLRARDVVETYERAAAEGQGATALDGEMIDLPVVERARQLLADAKRGVLHAD